MIGSNQPRSDRDVIIVGGGAAGLSAALVLGRARRRVTVIDAGAPRNAPAAHMHGFLSRDGLPPADLVAIGRSEGASYGVEFLTGTVTGIDPGFAVTLEDGTVLSARRILLATGVTDLLPDLAGVMERWGRDLLHCPYCHGWEVRDQPIGVLATHPASVQHALLVRQWSPDLVYFSHTQPVSDDERNSLEARNIDIIDGTVERLVIDDDRLTGIQLADGRIISRTAVFIRTVNRPNLTDPLASLGCDTDAAGFVVVDNTGRTSIPGVWAAGNLVDPRAQVITAAGAGSAAAIAINAELAEADTQQALTERAAVLAR